LQAECRATKRNPVKSFLGLMSWNLYRAKQFSYLSGGVGFEPTSVLRR
jgi:hypothetical protein